MLEHDPIPWLEQQEGEDAVRARFSLGMENDRDDEIRRSIVERLTDSQLPDGSFDHSPMKTAGTLCLLGDLRLRSVGVVSEAAEFLFNVFQSQPGYSRTIQVQPGALAKPCDLGGFFGPYEARNEPDALTYGAREMNFLREYEPILGPKSPVRAQRRSSRDRVGAGSCYAWGLAPLCYIIEALSCTGFHADHRLEPALSVLLGAQRESGGWCRNLAGHAKCTLYSLRAIGSHPELRVSTHAERALGFMHESWKQASLFPSLQAVARFDSTAAHVLLEKMISEAARKQRKSGTFGRPCQIERVTAVLAAQQSLGTRRSND